MAVITAFGRLEPENQELKVILEYMVRLCLKQHDNEACLYFHEYNHRCMP